MSNPNAKRLMDMALARAGLMPKPNGNPTYDESCLQCGDPATVKHTALAGENLSEDESSYWCESDFDFRWLNATVPTLRREGRITHVSQAIVPAATYDASEWETVEPSFWRN
jgi:hypothetical protein